MNLIVVTLISFMLSSETPFRRQSTQGFCQDGFFLMTECFIVERIMTGMDYLLSGSTVS
jgi:hypothetical protein